MMRGKSIRRKNETDRPLRRCTCRSPILTNSRRCHRCHKIMDNVVQDKHTSAHEDLSETERQKEEQESESTLTLNFPSSISKILDVFCIHGFYSKAIQRRVRSVTCSHTKYFHNYNRIG